MAHPAGADALLLWWWCRQLTVEHVLPQNPAANSGWGELFTPEQADHWAHRLGNLVLLLGRRNSKASNRGFAEKKAQYAGPLACYQGNNIPLTDAVSRLQRWGPAEVEKRQKEMMRYATNCWQLHNE